VDEGVHRVEFNTAGMSSGVYLCRLTADDHSATTKMVLTK
jgi:hypothetical protein